MDVEYIRNRVTSALVRAETTDTVTLPGASMVSLCRDVIWLCDEMHRLTTTVAAEYAISAAVYEEMLEFLERGIESYRLGHHSTYDRCDCAVCEWERELDDREAEERDF